ncbi:hypothetical protein Acel_0513 [Acidothermus cellulolyticus 11B]|uniref:Copper oxidase n=2 Tax=Acidothermus cellulolyticus TaxID=28049 RepID=A0LS76_ACIC1|nr:hypothetical protein Acel_0513 [Acidothermus cellulolyticus 11B]
MTIGLTNRVERPRRMSVPRGQWLGIAHLPIGAYLTAGFVALIGHAWGVMPRWLALHLTVLGAITNAIIAWSAHFTDALLVVPPDQRRPPIRRLLMLNTGVVAVLVGVPAGSNGVVIAGAVLIAGAIVGHIAAIARRIAVRRGRRFGWVAWSYAAAGGALIAGSGCGAALAVGVTEPWQSRVFAAHVLLNALGWIGLTVLASQGAMWPMVLATRPPAEAEYATRLTAVAAPLGLGVAAGGALAGSAEIVRAGLSGYVVAIGSVLFAFVRSAVGRRLSFAAWSMAAADGWLGWVAVDAGAAGGLTAIGQRLDAAVPWLVAGFVLQVFVGASTYLVPVVFGGGPSRAPRVAERLHRGWFGRWLLLNAALAVAAVSSSPTLRRGAWVAAFGVLGVALVLLGTAVIGSIHLRRRGTRAGRGRLYGVRERDGAPTTDGGGRGVD